MQRPFLLWQAEAAAQGEPGEPGVALPDGEELPPRADVVAAQEAIAAAVAREREQPLSPAPWAARRRRGGEEPRPIELRSYFPRDPVLSSVQSAIELYLLEHTTTPGLVQKIKDGSVRRRADGLASPGADYRLGIADEEIPAETASNRRIGRAQEITDVRWISALVAIGWGKLKSPEPFPKDPAPVRELAADARVVVVGDWASGNHRAQRVAKQIRRALDADEAKGRQRHVVHLGDTYYAGWGYEYRKRFLPHWPVEPDEAKKIGSWSLPGNHDMYTGGRGYYEVLLGDERFAHHHKGSSWFSLENEHWQLLGLDSASEDHDLAGRQGQWVNEELARHPGRRTMLMTHHQPFSAYKGDGPKLRAALEPGLGEGKIDAWLWGHEHRCAVYDPRPEVAAPRCIGHGGVPVYAHGRKPAGVAWHLDRAFRVGLETWAYCGFAVLDFDGPSVDVAYIDEYGQVDHEETI